VSAPDRDDQTPSAAMFLAPEAPLFTDNDPALLGQALAAAARAAASDPVSGMSLAFRFGEKLLGAGSAALRRTWRPASTASTCCGSPTSTR
jgi:hypothetical protein